MAVRPEELAFAGLRKSEINFSQCINLGISARYNFHKAFFITPALNIGRFTDSHASLFNHILIWQLGKQPTAFKIIPKDFQTHILGYSLDIGYHSKLGPINLMVQSNTYSNSWSLFFSIGFKMPWVAEPSVKQSDNRRLGCRSVFGNIKLTWSWNNWSVYILKGFCLDLPNRNLHHFKFQSATWSYHFSQFAPNLAE